MALSLTPPFFKFMQYKLTYKIVRTNPSDAVMGVGLYSEQVEDNLILSRMKEIQDEHNNNVKDIRTLPQFADFSPIELVA